MKPLSAKSQIVLVLCHLMGRRRSFVVGNWYIEDRDKYKSVMMIIYNLNRPQTRKVTIFNSTTYSRKWRKLKGEDYEKWVFGTVKPCTINQLGYFWCENEPTFTKSNNTWHLPKEFCKFLRAERDRILKEMK